MQSKIFSFFSGVGFLDLGFEKEDFEIVYVNELHKPFLEGYQYARNKLGMQVPVYGYHNGSITDFQEPPLRTHLSKLVRQSRVNDSLVGFIGGPPCPDFSIGGKNKGRHGDHGKLSHTYIELICRHKPDFFLIENVKGLWQTKRHREFYDELKLLLKDAGYNTTERLINAIEYGVPQDRERIILFGFRSSLIKTNSHGTDAPQSNEIQGFPWLQFVKYPDGAAFSYAWARTSPFSEGNQSPCPSNIPQELTVEHWFRRNDVENHENSKHHFTPRAGLFRFLSVDEGDDSRKSFKRLHRWRYSPTAAYGNNEVHLHPYKPRRITVAEALAIQTLPKAFSLPSDMTLSNMFKAVGNGVPYLAARMLARSLRVFINNHEVNGLKSRPSDRTAAA